LVRVENENTGGTVGWCLSPDDLAVSKLLAGRTKDIEFVKVMMRARLTNEPAIKRLLPELSSEQSAIILARVAQVNRA
jgi:hypothetical protein